MSVSFCDVVTFLCPDTHKGLHAGSSVGAGDGGLSEATCTCSEASM